MIIFAQIIVAAQMVIEEKFVNGKNIHPLRFIYWLENISKIRRLECISKIFGGVKYDITSFLTAILTFLNPNVDILNSPLTFIDFFWPQIDPIIEFDKMSPFHAIISIKKWSFLGPLDGKDFLVQ